MVAAMITSTNVLSIRAPVRSPPARALRACAGRRHRRWRRPRRAPPPERPRAGSSRPEPARGAGSPPRRGGASAAPPPACGARLPKGPRLILAEPEEALAPEDRALDRDGGASVGGGLDLQLKPMTRALRVHAVVLALRALDAAGFRRDEADFPVLTVDVPAELLEHRFGRRPHALDRGGERARHRLSGRCRHRQPEGQKQDDSLHGATSFNMCPSSLPFSIRKLAFAGAKASGRCVTTTTAPPPSARRRSAPTMTL